MSDQTAFQFEEPSPLIPGIPPFEFDRFGMKVNTSGYQWRLNDPSVRPVLHWETFPCEGEIRRACMLWVQFSIRSHMPLSVLNNFRQISTALKAVPPASSDLDSIDLNWWRQFRQKSREGHIEDRMNWVRMWFLWMSDLAFEGVDDEVAFEIEQWRLPGAVKGEAVMRRDKDSGPLTDLQFAVLIQALRRDQPPTHELAATMLCVDLGSNPKNLILLEERDFHTFTDPKTSSRFYLLSVPRIKKRIEERATKRRKISPETGAILQVLIDKNRQYFGGEDPKRPIFCRTELRRHTFDDVGMERFDYHWTSSEFALAVTKFGEKNRLRTPGTGDQDFRIFPRRLRYTFATRLAIEGAPPKVIAEALDHSDQQHVLVYVEAAGKLAERLSSALGPSMRPVVDRFLGRMVNGPEDAVPPNDLSKAVPAVLRGQLLGNIGTCGCGSMCMLVPPISCYLCEFFQPWRIADHEGLLGALKELVELMSKGTQTPFDRELIDRVIASVESVVDLKRAWGEPAE